MNNLDLQPLDQKSAMSTEDIYFPLDIRLADTVLKAGAVQPAQADILDVSYFFRMDNDAVVIRPDPFNSSSLFHGISGKQFSFFCRSTKPLLPREILFINYDLQLPLLRWFPPVDEGEVQEPRSGKSSNFADHGDGPGMVITRD
jgi:hypothetical protein